MLRKSSFAFVAAFVTVTLIDGALANAPRDVPAKTMVEKGAIGKLNPNSPRVQPDPKDLVNGIWYSTK